MNRFSFPQSAHVLGAVPGDYLLLSPSFVRQFLSHDDDTLIEPSAWRVLDVRENKVWLEGSKALSLVVRATDPIFEYIVSS